MNIRNSFSRFLRVIERDGFIAAFHQLHPDPIYFYKEYWERMTLGAQDGFKMSVDLLIQKGILIESEEADSRALETYRKSTTSRLDRPSILYLMLAQGCNNACTYCPIPEQARQNGNALLLFDDAVAGLKLWQEHLKEQNDDESYCMIFYGGEPLLNRKVLEQLLDFVAVERSMNHLPSKLELILPTNGLLIDSALAELLAKHDVLVVLGIDGAPSYNDVTRRTSEGSPTSAVIESVSRLLHGHGVRLAASMTLTPMNVHAVVEHKAYFDNLGITRIGFNVLKGVALQRSLNLMTVAEYYHVAAKAVMAGYTTENIDVQEYQLQKKLDALVKRQPFATDCTCYGNQVVIQVDGMVTNCPFLRADSGHVQSLPREFRISDTDVVQLWRQRIPLLIGDENVSANTTFLHGGGCAWNAFELHDDPVRYDNNNELFNSEVMHELVWKRLPQQARTRLLFGEISYWNYRGLRSL